MNEVRLYQLFVGVREHAAYVTVVRGRFSIVVQNEIVSAFRPSRV